MMGDMCVVCVYEHETRECSACYLAKEGSVAMDTCRQDLFCPFFRYWQRENTHGHSRELFALANKGN